MMTRCSAADFLGWVRRIFTIHVSQIIGAYCPRVALATGSSLCVIDRAVNAGAMAGAFDDQGLGVLGLLDDHE